MGNRSEKTGIRDKPRKCPFRVTTKMDYTCFEGCEPVVTKTTYEFARCYREGCPFYYYDTDDLSYKCKQCEELKEGNEYYER